MSQAIGLRTKIQQVLGYPINTYKFQGTQKVPPMMIVFTYAETEGAHNSQAWST